MNRVIAAQTDPQTARSYWTMGRRDSERAFRAARRHSRWVRVLRVAVPVAVVAGCVIMFLITYFNPLRMLAKLPINLNDLIVSGTKVTMEQPRMSGFTRDQRAYQLSAEAAAQDLTKPDVVELRNIHAQVEMQDKSLMKMSANNGIYNSKNETLKLDNNILLSSSGGYSGRLSEAMVNIRTGNVVSNQPIALKMLQGTLNANKLEIVENGDLVRFHGGVVMDMMLDNSSAAAPQKKAGAQ
jgi:lipopolysaccharide export system protein LptC